MRVVSADWVVPVEGAPIADGAVAIADDGTIAAVGAAAELGRGEHFEGCVIIPGFVNAHSHIEYAVYAGFGDGLPFVPWIGMHIQRKAALDFERHGRDRDRRGTRVPALGRDDDRGLQLLGRRRRSPRQRPACARSSTSRSSASDGPALERFHESHGRIERALSDRVLLGVSPHAPYTCTIEIYRACAELGPAPGDPLRRERRGARLARRRHRRLEPAGGVPRPAVRRDRDPHAGRSRACSARA